MRRMCNARRLRCVRRWWHPLLPMCLKRLCVRLRLRRWLRAAPGYCKRRVQLMGLCLDVGVPVGANIVHTLLLRQRRLAVQW